MSRHCTKIDAIFAFLLTLYEVKNTFGFRSGDFREIPCTSMLQTAVLLNRHGEVTCHVTVSMKMCLLFCMFYQILNDSVREILTRIYWLATLWKVLYFGANDLLCALSTFIDQFAWNSVLDICP